MEEQNKYNTENDEQQVLNVHDSFWKALGERDVAKRFLYCADRVTFIGSGLDEKAANKQEYIAINNKGIEQYPEKFEMETVWQRHSISGDMALVESELVWKVMIAGRPEKEMLRNTVILRKFDSQWLIVHVHGSMPDYRLSGQNYMTSMETSQRNIELEQQVYHRTRELNQAIENLQATQTQLIQAEKMASLGELTAGIAHEIQNPLNFVNNFSEVNTELIEEMIAGLKEGKYEESMLIASDIAANEQKINHHGKRADAIVKGMLQHSRSSNGMKEPTDINALAEEYLRLSYHGLRAKDKSFNATLETDFDNTIGSVNIIPQDIGRVLLNLINNAFYAATLPREKEFEQTGILHKPTVWLSTQKTGGRVKISVKDNGPGIPQKILDKIFQPFFTTKPSGQGTGLGLSLSYDIVKAHGGDIDVVTKELEGTAFTITLPV